MVLVNIIAYKIITHLYLFNNYIIYNVIDSIPIGRKNKKLVYFLILCPVRYLKQRVYVLETRCV